RGGEEVGARGTADRAPWRRRPPLGRTPGLTKEEDPYNGSLRRKGADLRCVWHCGELARQRRPRGESLSRAERLRQGLARLRRPMAGALPAGDGQGAQRRAPVGK